ncbi:hypothetical protein K353_04549 [Kitasatospora sp. SolWspMP-SS2h]|uniref:hypothetical protein n=1 Tax=Kitasatospora sp. SolWspMP-SS2h TaxID=1305729 RepID=UPI000DBA8300|nr:hypothetical protein [Kitasatospora sp. SolWspMP-SS2h]RAJ37632.1 hypothetical protein K353_04549 [Kitasatospora sp. SolWspMP-SS2h]
MTPHPPSEHPDLDALADLAEDLLPPERAAALHAHLAHCPLCAEDFAALCGLPALLADVPAPALPPDVADRLTAALAAESAARTERHPRPPAPAVPSTPAVRTASAPPRTTAPTGAPSGATGPGRPARRRRGARLLLATAAVAVAALAVGLGGSLLGRDTGRPDSAAGRPAADRSTAADGPALADGSRPTGTTGTAGTTGTTGTGVPRQVAPGGGGAEDGPEFTADGLPAQVRQLLESKAPHQLGQAASDGPAAAPSCALEAAGHPGERPAATSPGRYQGRPVLALVFRPPGGGGPLDVYLATPDCPGSTILLHSSVPAP